MIKEMLKIVQLNILTLVLVSKSDGSICFCMHYRRLDSKIKFEVLFPYRLGHWLQASWYVSRLKGEDSLSDP